MKSIDCGNESLQCITNFVKLGDMVILVQELGVGGKSFNKLIPLLTMRRLCLYMNSEKTFLHTKGRLYASYVRSRSQLSSRAISMKLQNAIAR